MFGCEKGTTRVAYDVSGELFFGTDREFSNSFRMSPDPKDVVIYLDRCKVRDYSSSPPSTLSTLATPTSARRFECTTPIRITAPSSTCSARNSFPKFSTTI